MPIKSYRLLYKLEGITDLEPAPGDAIPDLPGTTPPKVVKPIYCLMKKSIGDFLGVVPLEWDAPELTATFGGNGTNKGSLYRKRVGGFRVASYTLVAVGKFTINEYITQADGSTEAVPKLFKSISVGLPSGHSVNEFVKFLKTRGVINQVSAIITPAGRSIPVSIGTTGAAP